MTFAEKVLLDLYNANSGKEVDSAYSGNEERYAAYKNAVVQLSNENMIQGATILINYHTEEVEVVSLKNADITELGRSIVKSLL